MCLLHWGGVEHSLYFFVFCTLGGWFVLVVVTSCLLDYLASLMAKNSQSRKTRP